MSGDVKVRAHYFEKGNTHLNLDKSFDNIPCKNAASASDIITAIAKSETNVSTPQFIIYICLLFLLNFIYIVVNFPRLNV